jgi:putative membrane protein
VPATENIDVKTPMGGFMKFRQAGLSAALVAAVTLAPLAAGVNSAYAQTSTTQNAADNPAADNPAASSTNGAQALSDTDRQFVHTAAVAGTTEIDAARLAMRQSNDKSVKAFAAHMIADHTKLAMQLKAAVPHGVDVPKEADTSALDSIRSLKGSDFDSAYISKFGVQGHKDAIAAFQDEAQNGQDASLKKAAQKALPTIQHHYAMAQELAKKKNVMASQ